MIHLNVPNLFYLFTIYSITHIGTYMRRLTATRLNQNVLRSVDFYAIPPVLHVMVYHQGIYELKIPGFSVHFQEWLLYSLDNQHTIWSYFLQQLQLCLALRFILISLSTLHDQPIFQHTPIWDHSYELRYYLFKYTDDSLLASLILQPAADFIAYHSTQSIYVYRHCMNRSTCILESIHSALPQSRAIM